MDYFRGLEILVCEAEGAPTADEMVQAFQAHLRKKESKAKVDSLAKRLLREARAFRSNTKKLNELIDLDDTVEILNNLAGKRRGRSYWMSGTISIPMLDSGIHQLTKADTVPQKLLAMARLVMMIGDHQGRLDPGTLYPYLMQVEDWNPAKREQFKDTLQNLSGRLVQQMAHQVVRQGEARPLAPARPLGW